MNTDRIKSDIVVICGPTGVGKTSAGIELAKRFNGEIINADSMQIYRYMDIGTAKPTKAEQSEVPHHLIDIIDPDEHFDAEIYSEKARKIVHMLHGQGIIPFVVGGTGFYIKALEHGLFDPGLADPVVREKLKKEAGVKGTGFLYDRLRRSDPETAAVVHPNDTYRIIRALEIYELTGEGISSHRRRHDFSDQPFNVLKIGLKMKRETLYDRINKRVDKMLAEGFIDEVMNLLDKGYPADLKSMQSIGYRHLTDFIQERHSLKEAVRIMKRDTRRYAKRQFTWFQADDCVTWFEPDQLPEMRKMVENFLNIHPSAEKKNMI